MEVDFEHGLARGFCSSNMNLRFYLKTPHSLERLTLPAVFCPPENKNGLDKLFIVKDTATGQKNSLEIVVVQLLCFFANA